MVQEWSTKWPDANVGIVADQNIIILESDDYERLSEVVKTGTGKEMPVTLMACGSSEKRPHLFFQRTEASVHVGNMVVPGLFEARFFNQYVVGPGSVHPSGAVYRWLNDSRVTVLPDWLLAELCRLAQSTKTAPKSSAGAVINTDTLGLVTEGSRHYFLMSELGKLWDGKKPYSEMIQYGWALNERCNPPKALEHVRQCVRDIMKREPNDPGPAVVFGAEEKKTPDTWISISAGELKAKKIEPRDVILEERGSPLFYERSVNQILAWRGIGKTNFALGLAGTIASGGRILDFDAPKPRRVLYIDGELPLYQLQERAKLLGVDDRVQMFSPELREPPASLDLIGGYNQLEALIDRNGTEVLFIDSQSTTMRGDTMKNDFQEDHSVLLRDLRLKNLCVVEMHHVGKEGRQRGLSKNDDILDVQIQLKQTENWEPGDGLQFELSYEKVRHAARLESGYFVNLIEGQWVKRVADDIQSAADILNKGGDIKDIIKQLKVQRTKAYSLRRKALAKGLIQAEIAVQINEGA